MSSPRKYPFSEPQTVWTDEFDPNGETLPVTEIQRRRAARPAPAEVPLGLDLNAPLQRAPRSTLQREPSSDALFPQNEDFIHTAALIQLLRSGQA